MVSVTGAKTDVFPWAKRLQMFATPLKNMVTLAKHQPALKTVKNGRKALAKKTCTPKATVGTTTFACCLPGFVVRRLSHSAAPEAGGRPPLGVQAGAGSRGIPTTRSLFDPKGPGMSEHPLELTLGGHLSLNVEVWVGKTVTGPSSAAAVNPQAALFPAESQFCHL